MPVYEFVCEDCNARFDTLVRSLNSADDVTCQDCSSEHVRRLISTFAVGGFDDPMTAARSEPGGGCCGGSCGCRH